MHQACNDKDFLLLPLIPFSGYRGGWETWVLQGEAWKYPPIQWVGGEVFRIPGITFQDHILGQDEGTGSGSCLLKLLGNVFQVAGWRIIYPVVE